MRSRHVSVVIARPPDEVYRLAADPSRLPEWAAGLAEGTAEISHDTLVMDSPMGRVSVRFVPHNDLGVLDHEVALPDGSVTYNPLRVVPHPEGAEVVFTIRQQDLDDDDFERDCERVAEDLDRLRRLLEDAVAPAEAATREAGSGAPAEVTLRLAGPADAGSVTRLLHDFNSEFDCPGPDPARDVGRIERLLAADDVLVVVASGALGGHDVGLAFLSLRPTAYWDGPLAHLEDLYVRPDLRSRGVGTALLDRAMAEVRALNALEMHIIVDDADVDARRFYRRNGFDFIDPDSGSRMRLFLRQL